MVRVYAHNLRQKLEQYYATAGRIEPRQLVLARGEYRISLAEQSEPTVGDDAVALAQFTAAAQPEQQRSSPARWQLGAAAAALLGLGIALGAGIAMQRGPAMPAAATVAKSPLWAGLLDDDLPILVVVGDYYIYGELDERGDVSRL